MLQTFFSHRTEDLFDALKHRHLAADRDPLSPVTVLVQSQGMARWLQLRLAQSQGIACHLYLPNLRAFIEQVLVACGCLGGQNKLSLPLWGKGGFAAERPWLDRELLPWRLYDRFPEMPEASPLRLYAGKDELRTWRICGELAQVYDDYQLFRHGEYLEAWRQNHSASADLDLDPDTEKWQAELFRDLTRDCPQERASSFGAALHKFLQFSPDQLKQRLEDAAMPPRLALFGMAALPPDYLNFFLHLGQCRQVELFAFNPSCEFWGEDRRREVRLALISGDNSALAEHPFLGAWGKLGRDLLHRLLDHDERCDIEFLEAKDPEAETNLFRLQQAVLAATPDLHAFSPPRRSFAPDAEAARGDDSLNFFACRSPLREAEILRDFLLRQFALDQQLRSEDVLILTPDLETYAPLLQAVFARKDPQSLPLSVADGGGESLTPAAGILLTLLRLGTSRCTASETLGILEFPAVATRLGLDAEGLALARAKLQAAGLHWGLDAVHHQEEGCPAFAEFSWDWALERLLAGYAAGNALLPDLAAVPMTALAEAPLLAALLEFRDKLTKWRSTLKKEATPEQWQSRFNELLEDFFLAPRDDAELRHQVSSLHRGCGHLLSAWREAGLSRPLGAAVVADALQDLLESPEDSASGFIRGGITLARLLPMRSIPARVIALVGMNEGVFPRQDNPPSFHLMRRQAQPGDRSAAADDRFLFLETLMACRQNLFISWIGRDPYKDESLPPSTPVAELLSCLGEKAADGQAWIQEPPLHAFSPKTFFAGNGSFSSDAAAACAAFRQAGTAAPFCRQPLPPLDSWKKDGLRLKFKDLVKLLKNAPQFFCEKRLGIFLSDYHDAEIDDAETFENPDHLAQHGYKQEILASLDQGLATEEARRHFELRRAGELPFRRAERQELVGTLVNDMQSLARKPRSPATSFVPFVHRYKSPLMEIILEDEIPEGSWDERCLSKLCDDKGKLSKPHYLVRAWPQAAALLKQNPAATLTLHSPDTSVSVEPGFDLNALLELAVRALQEPLPLNEEAIAALGENKFDPWVTWEGTSYGPKGCKDNPYFRLCFGDDNPWDEERWKSFLDELLPIPENPEKPAKAAKTPKAPSSSKSKGKV